MTFRSSLFIQDFLFAFAIVFCNSGCVSGPKDPEQNFAQKLNANSYESSNTVMGVPVLTRTTSKRKITGKLTCGEGLSLRPASHASISLNDGDKIIATTSSESDGSYAIIASVFSENLYQLKVSAKCGSTLKEISLKEDSSFDIHLKN